MYMLIVLEMLAIIFILSLFQDLQTCKQAIATLKNLLNA